MDGRGGGGAASMYVGKEGVTSLVSTRVWK